MSDLIFSSAAGGADLCFGECPSAPSVTGTLSTALEPLAFAGAGAFAPFTAEGALDAALQPLAFAGGGVYSPFIAEGALQASLAPLLCGGDGVYTPFAAEGAITAALPPLAFAGEGAYDNAVTRLVTRAAGLPSPSALASCPAWTALYGTPIALRAAARAGYTGADRLPAPLGVAWVETERLRGSARLRATAGDRTSRATGIAAEICLPALAARGAAFNSASGTRLAVLAPFVFLVRAPRLLGGGWRGAVPAPAATGLSAARGVSVRFHQGVPWGLTTRPAFVWPRTRPGGAPAAPAPVWGADLHFKGLSGADLHFGPLAVVRNFSIPSREVYPVMHSIFVNRVSDGLPVEVLSVRCSLDLASWVWGFDLTLADEAGYAAIQPSGGLVLLDISLDGEYVFRMVAETWRRHTVFGRTAFSVSGRTEAAYLARPYGAARSYTETETRSALQLAVQELAGSGWSVDWQTVDWLVPPGAYSYGGLTSMDAIRHVAGAVGAVCQADRYLKTIHVLPRYPVSPWLWDQATPDVIVPEAVILGRELRYDPKPAYNAVYVVGQTGDGVIVRCRRAGTAGDTMAPQIVHPLVTSVDAGREMGRVALSGTADWETVGIETVLAPPDVPLVLPGSLVRVEEASGAWMGQVTGVVLEAGRGAIGQRLDVERRAA